MSYTVIWSCKINDNFSYLKEDKVFTEMFVKFDLHGGALCNMKATSIDWIESV